MAKGFLRPHDGIWTEKYRPLKLEDYITSGDFREKFENFIKTQSISNIILEGSAGGGKSTLSNLLVSSIDCDIKMINAAEERGIDVVREDIKKFLSTSSFSPLKILVLEEFSEFTPDAQNALKSMLEMNTDTTRTIITCNSVERIIEPIRSRFQEFKIIPPSKAQIEERCKYILNKEKVSYEIEEVKQVVKNFYPDVRKVIQYLDQQSINGELKLDKEFFKLLKYEKKIVEILSGVTKDNLFIKVNDVRQLIADTRIRNFITLYQYLYEALDDYIPKDKIIGAILIIQEGLRADTFIADKEINMISTLVKLLDLKCS